MKNKKKNSKENVQKGTRATYIHTYILEQNTKNKIGFNYSS